MMKTKYILKGVFASILLTLVFASCESYTVPVIDELLVDRAFSPIGVKAIVRNQTNVELSWTVRDDVDHYVVEFSADDEEFKAIYKKVEVAPTELPITVALEGETTYSIRVKAISTKGLEDSKWITGKITTLSEQILNPILDADILAKEATLRWIPNSNVTQITLNPGNITHTITAQEKTNGVAKITGLSAETSYTATLKNGVKVRGTRDFKTGIDIGNATLIKPTDNLIQKIADAADGAVLVLESGDYTAQKGSITLSKSITLRGLKSFDKPLLKNGFFITSDAINVSLIDLDIEGEGVLVDSYNDLIRYNAAGNYESLLISGCTIHNFRKTFIGGDITSSLIKKIIVENCRITDIWCNGGDFIDFRKTNVLDIQIRTSTFNNCASYASTGARDFFRIDAAGATGTGLITKLLLENCTLYNVSNSTSAIKRILYVRFNNHNMIIRNNLFAETKAVYSDQATTNPAPLTVFLNNKYANALGLYDATTKVFDASGANVVPGFKDPATGDFTISNQTLKDNLVGDPRWIK
ncbi:MAG: DUF4957 domain-containing protein [Flavobacterium sp.]